jgi:acylphosphatase
MDSYRCVVEGRVQGVGFRYFVLRQAQRFGIVGWVRNLDNGAVEFQAEGEADPMRRFLDKVRSGPSFAYVTSVDVREVAAEGFKGFSIVR